MKLLFITDGTLDSPASGTEQVASAQARGLRRMGAKVCAIGRRDAPPGPLESRESHGVSELVVSAPVDSTARFLASLGSRLPRAFARLQDDWPFSAVVVHQPMSFCLLSALGRMRNLPVVYVFHSPWQEEYALKIGADSGGGAAGRIRGRLERFALCRAVTVMTLSSYMAEKVQGLHAIPAERIAVNPGGVDLERFSPPEDRRESKARLGLPPGALHLLTVRNLEPRMGLGNLVSAMKILESETPGLFHLTIGGDGPLKESLARQVREAGLSSCVSMAGFVPADVLPEAMGAADFFVLPTESLEGFGLVTPEAMACGTPVLGTPVGGTREILGNFEPGLLFADASPEGIARGIKNASLGGKKGYSGLRRRCREHAEKNYSWQRHVESLAAALSYATGERFPDD